MTFGRIHVVLRATIALLLVTTCNLALSQSTNPAIKNTTSACAPSGQPVSSWCNASFNGLVITRKIGCDTCVRFTGTVNGSAGLQYRHGNDGSGGNERLLGAIQELLYPGFTGAITTKIVCYYEPWWGLNAHINIGMNLQTNATAIVAKQAQNMIDRGCNYVVLDWYGKNPSSATATQINGATLAWRDYLDSR